MSSFSIGPSGLWKRTSCTKICDELYADSEMKPQKVKGEETYISVAAQQK